MAETVATPDNLNKFAKELGERLAQYASGGNSNLVFIDSYISKNVTTNDDISHVYLVIDKDFDLSNVSLQYQRKKRVKVRRNNNSPYYDNDENHRAHTTGWHEVLRLPISNREPLIRPILKSTTPNFILGGNAYYEITVDGYEQFIDFVTDDSFGTGYCDQEGSPVPISAILRKNGGVCLIKDGKQISNFAMFRAQYDDTNNVWNMGK